MKRTITQRLKIIRGQINGLIRLIEKEEDCQKVTAEFYAINAGLKRAIELYLRENLDSCLVKISSKRKRIIHFLLKELIKAK